MINSNGEVNLMDRIGNFEEKNIPTINNVDDIDNLDIDKVPMLIGYLKLFEPH